MDAPSSTIVVPSSWALNVATNSFGVSPADLASRTRGDHDYAEVVVWSAYGEYLSGIFLVIPETPIDDVSVRWHEMRAVAPFLGLPSASIHLLDALSTGDLVAAVAPMKP